MNEWTNKKGEKISPIEVDAVLLAHPEVAQAVAFGVPDDKYGEEVIFYFFIFILHFSFYLFNIYFCPLLHVYLRLIRTICLFKYFFTFNYVK